MPLTPIILLDVRAYDAWLAAQPEATRHWCAASGFTAKAGAHLLLPGETASVLALAEAPFNVWTLGHLPDALPPGDYHLDDALEDALEDAIHAELWLGWQLGAYRFSRYKSTPRSVPALRPPHGPHAAFARATAQALCDARDLINTPANDLGPEELAQAAQSLAQRYGASCRIVRGEALLVENYPAIHTVGRASSRPPCLVDMQWGERGQPKVTLVGKGVCFDSGGLDIKPSSGMKLMKKDMGGGACVLALATLIMEAGLRVRLRVLIPAVENSIAGNAYRPSDIIATRKGIFVEVGNTDAEGRLILCDALAEADGESPDCLIDCATLTGAARTALGPELPALFTPDDAFAERLTHHAHQARDPLWRLPLWPGYRPMLDSEAAPLNSAPDSPYAGAIAAALYLKEFVTQTPCWAHIDMMAWNTTKRPGRPIGGEAMTVRALFHLLKERYPKPEV